MLQGQVKILHVFGALNRGGAETMIMNVFRNIDRSKVQFDFIVHSLEEGAYDQEIKRLGGKIHYIPRYNGKNHYTYIKAWKEFFQNNPEYKIIHGHLRSTASIYLKIAKNYGVYTIAHSHSTSSRGNYIEKSIKNILQLQIKYIADTFIACSVEAGKWLFGKKIIESTDFFVLPNAIDVQQYIFNELKRENIRATLKIKESDLVIGHVGSFTDPKNHDYLIDIFTSLHNEIPNSKLLLLGDGPLKNDIEIKVQKLALQDSVLFLGSQPNVNDYMQAMDVFVMPSKFEGLPVTLIEAQAAGLPCIIPSYITNEVVITDLVSFVEHYSDKNEWISLILSSAVSKRSNQYKSITENGYNVHDTAKKMEEFYLEKYENITEIIK